MIFAACRQVIFLTKALEITSCTLVARPLRPSSMSPSFHRPLFSLPAKAHISCGVTTGHIICYRQRVKNTLTSRLAIYKVRPQLVRRALVVQPEEHIDELKDTYAVLCAGTASRSFWTVCLWLFIHSNSGWCGCLPEMRAYRADDASHGYGRHAACSHAPSMCSSGSCQYPILRPNLQWRTSAYKHRWRRHPAVDRR